MFLKFDPFDVQYFIPNSFILFKIIVQHVRFVKGRGDMR